MSLFNKTGDEWSDPGMDPADDGDGCDRCGGRGYYVDCIDDMCHGQEECIHGDGYRACPCQYEPGAAPPEKPAAPQVLGKEGEPGK